MGQIFCEGTRIAPSPVPIGDPKFLEKVLVRPQPPPPPPPLNCVSLTFRFFVGIPPNISITNHVPLAWKSIRSPPTPPGISSSVKEGRRLDSLRKDLHLPSSFARKTKDTVNAPSAAQQQDEKKSLFWFY